MQEGEKLFEIARLLEDVVSIHRLRAGPAVFESRSGCDRANARVARQSLSGPKIKFINPNIDDATRSARVRVEIDNPNRELRHKLYAEGTVDLDAPDVLCRSEEAVLWPGDNPRVYVDQGNGAYQQRRVILGRPGDEFWEVLEGVKEGERVVASGNMLIDGQAQLLNVSCALRTNRRLCTIRRWR